MSRPEASAPSTHALLAWAVAAGSVGSVAADGAIWRRPPDPPSTAGVPMPPDRPVRSVSAGGSPLPAPAVPEVRMKPRLRGVLHQYAFFVSLASGTLLVLLAPTTKAALYATSMSALFGVSALYHRATWTTPARRRMRRLDHSMIFLLIAGTYTPVGLLVLEGTLASVVLAVVWGGAAAGIVLELAWTKAPRWLGGHGVSGSWLGGGGGHAAAVRPPRAGRGAVDRGRRAGLLGRGGRVCPAPPRPGAGRVRLPRGVPPAGDRRGGRPLPGHQPVRPAQRVNSPCGTGGRRRVAW